MKLYLGGISSNCVGLHEFCIKGVGNLDEYTPGLIDVCEASSPRLRTLELEVHKASAGTLEKITGQFPSLKVWADATFEAGSNSQLLAALGGHVRNLQYDACLYVDEEFSVETSNVVTLKCTNLSSICATSISTSQYEILSRLFIAPCPSLRTVRLTVGKEDVPFDSSDIFATLPGCGTLRSFC